MAKEVVKTENVKESTSLAEMSSTDLAAFAEFAGAGFEQVSAQDINIPYIQFLQTNSPQCKKGNEKRLDGATEGDIAASGLNRLYKVDDDGNSELNLSVVQKITLLTEWAPNRGGMRGQHSLAEKDSLGIKKTKNADGKDILVLPNGNEVVETDYLFCIAVPPEHETPFFCILPASSTKRTAIRQLITSLTFDAQGALPMFAFIYTLGTSIKTKDTWSWVVPKFTKVTSDCGVSYVDSRGIINTKDAFGKQIFEACANFLKAIKTAGGPEKFLSRTNFNDYEEVESVDNANAEAAGDVI